MKRVDILGVILIILASVAVALATESIISANNSSEHASQQAEKALSTSIEAKNKAEIAKEVGLERREAIFRGCKEQNHRNHNSLKFLKELGRKQIASKKPGPERKLARKELRKALGEYKALFHALAPVENCKKLVKKSTHP